MSPEHHKDIAHWLTRPGSTLTKPAVTAFVPLQLGFNGGQPAGWPYPITPDDVHGVEAALHAPVQQAGRADVLFVWNWAFASALLRWGSRAVAGLVTWANRLPRAALRSNQGDSRSEIGIAQRLK
jgi:hypothetical protein